MSEAPRERQRFKDLNRQRLGLIGIVAALTGTVCAVLDPQEFWPGYLVALLFWMQITLGCLGIGLLHPLVGGNWGWWIGRQVQAGIGTLGVIAVAAIPLIPAARFVYPWAAAETELNAHQATYLAPGMVLMRAVVIWPLLAGMGMWLMRCHVRTARRPEQRAHPRLAALGMVVYWIAATTVFIDSIMSLDPSWSSSIFGALQILASAVAAMAWVALARCREVRGETLVETAGQSLHDVANLLLAFNLLWVYCAFSQYLIIWSGDLPQEVSWYAARQSPAGTVTAVILLFLHFVVPFCCLLSAELKRNPQRLAGVAALLLAARLLDLCWTVFPACEQAGVISLVGALIATIGIGLVWCLVNRRIADKLPVIDSAAVSAVEHIDVRDSLASTT